MTGKEMIVYILDHNLENEGIFKDGTFIGFITAQELASKFHVGVEAVNVWVRLGWIDGITIGNNVYFLKETPDPRNGRA